MASKTAPNMDLDTGDSDIRYRDSAVRDVAVGELDELSVSAGSIGERTILHQSVEIAMQRRWTHYYHGSRARLRGMRRMPASTSAVWPETLDLPEDSSRKQLKRPPPHETVYRNVCTDQDPPYSVAISPSKRCVAFGCVGGIELYWLDPQTGQDLNRWFPLIKPSDHLYFLPPRQHIDSDSRLRLISSASFAEPSSNDEGDRSESAAASSRVSTWFTLAASWQFRTPRGAKHQAHALDHSQAVPLRDGHHILFLDNATGLLCLGSDKPLGSVYRLARKFVFMPPPRTQIEDTTFARVYAATSAPSAPSMGVRIVAAYGKHVVIYSIPPDLLKYSTAEQQSAVQPSATPFNELATLQLLRHPLCNASAVRDFYDDSARFNEVSMKWVHHLPAGGGEAKSLEELWPMQISGSIIGSLEGVATLAVQETMEEGLTVWALARIGVAKAWRVDDGERPVLSVRSTVDRDGAVGEKTVDIVES